MLPVAAATLGPVPYPTHWCAGDLLGWATSAAANKTPIDILHSAFAIHHLNDEAKETMLRGAPGRIHPEGLFLWADVFRGAVESEGRRSPATASVSKATGGPLRSARGSRPSPTSVHWITPPIEWRSRERPKPATGTGSGTGCGCGRENTTAKPSPCLLQPEPQTLETAPWSEEGNPSSTPLAMTHSAPYRPRSFRTWAASRADDPGGGNAPSTTAPRPRRLSTSSATERGDRSRRRSS